MDDPHGIKRTFKNIAEARKVLDEIMKKKNKKEEQTNQCSPVQASKEVIRINILKEIQEVVILKRSLAEKLSLEAVISYDGENESLIFIRAREAAARAEMAEEIYNLVERYFTF